MEASNNAFLEKEKDLHHKIGELEEILGVLNQKSVDYSETEAEKVCNLEVHCPNQIFLVKWIYRFFYISF